MKRELTSHAIEGYNGYKPVVVLDEPGDGGACHEYICYHDPDGKEKGGFSVISFQNGPIQVKGHNGLTNEQLLAVLIDRMEGFQGGDFASQDNQDALNFMRSALKTLQKRTVARIKRGVEGTHEK